MATPVVGWAAGRAGGGLGGRSGARSVARREPRRLARQLAARSRARREAVEGGVVRVAEATEAAPAEVATVVARAAEEMVVVRMRGI